MLLFRLAGWLAPVLYLSFDAHSPPLIPPHQCQQTSLLHHHFHLQPHQPIEVHIPAYA